ncbi:MAG: NAD(P)-dependent oxidoreductase [Panacibacter sp.]
MKKILVTGATGFIGNHVVQELLKNNFTVIATSAHEQKAKQYSWFNKVNYIPFKLEDFDNAINYASFFQNPVAIIHLAWEGLPNYKSLFHFEVNLPRHYSFLKNLVLNGVADLTITGTCFEYGMQQGCLDENMRSMPANPYALAKDTFRKFLEELKHISDFELKWIRLFYMYGSGQNPNSLLSQLDKALANRESAFNMSGGEQVRDYLPVEKVAEYIAAIVLQNKVTGIINCCSGVPITVKELVENYLEEQHKNIQLNLGYYPYPDFEPMRFWGDDKKLKTIINNG